MSEIAKQSEAITSAGFEVKICQPGKLILGQVIHRDAAKANKEKAGTVPPLPKSVDLSTLADTKVIEYLGSSERFPYLVKKGAAPAVKGK